MERHVVSDTGLALLAQLVPVLQAASERERSSSPDGRGRAAEQLPDRSAAPLGLPPPSRRAYVSCTWGPNGRYTLGALVLGYELLRSRSPDVTGIDLVLRHTPAVPDSTVGKNSPRRRPSPVVGS